MYNVCKEYQVKTYLSTIAIAGATLALTFAPIQNTRAQKMDTKTFEPSGDWAQATFAGGCLWCMEKHFDETEGVISTTSGYTGGDSKAPSYEEVCTGFTGHTESILVEYDPQKVTYEQLLDVFWRNVDPTTPNRQFCDVGTQYRPEVFYHDEAQKLAAEAAVKKLEESGRFKTIAVAVTPAAEFWVAEEYHQNFYKKQPDHYNRYREGCGRDQRLEQLWGSEDS